MPPSLSPSRQSLARNILLTIPRTATSLVIRILNLSNQRIIARHPEDGYYFLPALKQRYQHDTFSRPFKAWSDTETSGMKAVLQSCCDEWYKRIEDAEHAGKGTKEHLNWMIEPEVESIYLHGGSES